MPQIILLMFLTFIYAAEVSRVYFTDRETFNIALTGLGARYIVIIVLLYWGDFFDVLFK